MMYDTFDTELTSAMPCRMVARDAGSLARRGRTSPIPPEASVSLARLTIPPARHSALANAQIRFLVPLGAAFLALGVVLGILLFFPLR